MNFDMAFWAAVVAAIPLIILLLIGVYLEHRKATDALKLEDIIG